MKNSTNKFVRKPGNQSVNRFTNGLAEESAKDSAQNILKNIPQKDLRNIRRILAHIKGVSYETVMLYPEKILLNQKESEIFAELIERYERAEPISKIIGQKSFWKNDFYVNFAVLDPRPETEIIIEAVLQCFNEKMHAEKREETRIIREPQKILDIGTGSGCILLSLLREFKNTQGIGIDISQEAIEVARKNREMVGIDRKRAVFLNIGWNDLEERGGKGKRKGQEKEIGEDEERGEIRCIGGVKSLEDVDVIVSNPPYIRSAEIEELDENVRNYDPRIALYGGRDGLDSYREICAIAAEIFRRNQRKKHLRKQSIDPKHKKQENNGRNSGEEFVGRIFLEVGYDQAKDVSKILKENGFKMVETRRDLAGIERVVEGVFGSEDSADMGASTKLMNR